MVSPADADDGGPDHPLASGVPALSLKNIVKSFPGVRALRGVSLEVFPGEVHALLGENGAGKSTLIKILSGVYTPDEGEMRIRGRVVHFSEPGQAQAQGIATIYQEFSLYPELTVTENIFSGHIPRTLGGFALDWRRAEAEAVKLLQSLDAADIDVRARTGSLSVGNRQRVEIAKALSFKARVLILDEPTAVLTQHDVDRLFAIVRNLRSRGAAIIYISHRLDEIFALADRVTVLRDGQWVATQDATDITEAELIRQMVGRALEEEPIVHDAPAQPDSETAKLPILRIRNLKRRLSRRRRCCHTGREGRESRSRGTFHSESNEAFCEIRHREVSRSLEPTGSGLCRRLRHARADRRDTEAWRYRVRGRKIREA
jgi:ABC-type sugar transport system ATPase subunit